MGKRKQRTETTVQKLAATAADVAEFMASQNGSAELGNGFAEKLGRIASKVELALPKLADIIAIPEGDEDKKLAAMEEVVAGVTTALSHKLKVNKSLAACADHRRRKIIQENERGNLEKAETYLQDALALKGVLGSAAAVAYLKVVLSQRYESHAEAAAAINDLINKKLLIEADAKARREDTIPHGYLRLEVSSHLGFDEQDSAEVTTVVREFSRTAMALEKQRRVTKAKALCAKANITVTKLLAKANGSCFVDVPAEELTDGSWRGGGALLIGANAKHVYPLDASGAIEGAVAKMAEMKVRLERYTLDWDTPPGWGPAFRRVVKAIEEATHVSSAEAEAYLKKVQAFWFILTRGLDNFQSEATVAKERAEMSAKADITSAEFFGLNGSKGVPEQGTAFLQFPDVFKQKGGSDISGLFLLVSRGEGTFRALEIPAHLKDVLGEFVGQEYPDTNDFRDCPPLLSRVMRAIRGKTAMEAEVTFAEQEMAEATA